MSGLLTLFGAPVNDAQPPLLTPTPRRLRDYIDDADAGKADEPKAPAPTRHAAAGRVACCSRSPAGLERAVRPGQYSGNLLANPPVAGSPTVVCRGAAVFDTRRAAYVTQRRRAMPAKSCRASSAQLPEQRGPWLSFADERLTAAPPTTFARTATTATRAREQWRGAFLTTRRRYLRHARRLDHDITIQCADATAPRRCGGDRRRTVFILGNITATSYDVGQQRLRAGGR
jgi:hypothetical protein